MDFDSLYDKFESVMKDKEDKNHGHIDVKTITEKIANIVATENT